MNKNYGETGKKEKKSQIVDKHFEKNPENNKYG